LGAGPSGANKQFGYVYANTGSFTTVAATTVAATNTSSLALLNIGKNNSRVTFPGQTTYANSMLFANDNTSGPIIFTTKGASVNRNLMISRTAGLVFHEGAQISSQSNGGLLLSAMSTATASTMAMSAGFQSMSVGLLTGVSLSTYNGVDQWVTTMNTATGSWSFPGDITVTNTATVATLKFGDGTTMTTAATSGTSFDQTLNTTSNVTFGGVVVNGTIEASTIRKAGYPGLSNMEIQGNLTPQTSGQSDLGAGPGGANKQFGYVYANTGSFTTVVATGIVQFGVYTATALNSITGAVGQMASVSNSAGGGHPNGMMAFWDTTNSRWSYIHDNSAV
jgi:hypothetical protein